MMTFSSTTKEELYRMKPEGRSEKLALLSAIISSIGVWDNALIISTDVPAFARLIHMNIKSVFKINPQLLTKESVSFSKKNIYSVVIADTVLQNKSIDVIDYMKPFVPIAFQKELFKIYLRGLYLSCGSVTSPEKSYHLELIIHSKLYAEQLVELMNQHFSLSAKYTIRKKDYIIYLKESERIVDFLNVIGATKSLLAFENVRVLKQIRNNVNRAVNCETANITKITDAATRQVAAITYLKNIGELKKQSDKMKEIAEIRLKNPNDSLKELGERLSPTVGKSGVYHRMNKIITLAQWKGFEAK